MASAHMFGGCACEAGLPIHQTYPELLDEAEVVDDQGFREDGMICNAEICALAAPRPQLLISVTHRAANGQRCGTKDQSCNTPEVEYPFLRKVYGLLGGGHDVQNVHFDSDHEYGEVKRQVMYAFLAHHLELQVSRLPSKAPASGSSSGGGGRGEAASVDESFVKTLGVEQLQVWRRGSDRWALLPKDALHGWRAVNAAFWHTNEDLV